jgi:hypothetical protein
MLLVSHAGFDYTGAQCHEWMSAVGFRDSYVEPLVGPDLMVVGLKWRRPRRVLIPPSSAPRPNPHEAEETMVGSPQTGCGEHARARVVTRGLI